jgi:hypothetical protein
MKKYFYLFVAVILTCTSQAFAQAPTFDFEDWTTFPEAPRGWFTSSVISPLAKPVSKSTDMHAGSYAMKLETKISQGDTVAGFAMTGEIDMTSGFKLGFPFKRKAKSISFYYKYSPDSTGDSMNFAAILSKFDTASQTKLFVGIAAFTESAIVGSYVKQDVVFMYDSTNNFEPDSMFITIFNSDAENPKLGSVLFIDDISVDTPVVTSVFAPAAGKSLQVNTYPNPVQYSANFAFELSQPEKVTIKVYDMLGKEVATVTNESKATGKHVIPFDVTSLNKGIYMYQIIAGEASTSGKLNVIR